MKLVSCATTKSLAEAGITNAATRTRPMSRAAKRFMMNLFMVRESDLRDGA